MELLIKNVRIVDESKDFHGDLYIQDGLIQDYGVGLDRDCQVLEGNNFTLMPAFIDLHAHFRDQVIPIRRIWKPALWLP